MRFPPGLSSGLAAAAAGFQSLMVLKSLIPSWMLSHSESLKLISAVTSWSTSDLLILQHYDWIQILRISPELHMISAD